MVYHRILIVVRRNDIKMQISKQGTLILSLALGIMFVFVAGSIFRMNGFVMPHTILHTIGLILALFLIAVALSAYRRVMNNRFLLLALGFVGFVIIEGINLSYALLLKDISELSILNIELPHIFGVYILMLMVITIFRGDKQ